MRRPVHFLVLILGLLASPVLAQAPKVAVLVADDVFLDGEDRLIAEGNVEALYDNRRLQARRITYDRSTEEVQIEGPITLTETDGRVVILADMAELDRSLANGLLRGARMVLDQQVQLAANEMNRVNGRFSQLYKAAVTSCQVCEKGRPPLWQIRAQRVIHDQEERQLYFEKAQFRVLDTPIFYIPRLRLPDPTLTRATGFLVPSVRNSSTFGTGVRVPYFIKMRDHADLTLTPFIATESKTLEYRFRRAFRTGEIAFEGAVSNDDLGERSTRAYLFGAGRFELPQDFMLRFNVEAVNDRTYLLDYDYSDKDRLESQISLERARRDEYIRGAVTYFRTLRDGESNTTIPSLAADVEYERRFFPARLGGELVFAATTQSHFRSSDLETDGPDIDPFADGLDMMTLTTSVDWFRSWTLPAGVRARLQGGAVIDSYFVEQGGLTSDSRATELTPTTSVQLRWPLQKTTPGGVIHVIEPVVQLAWAGGDTPNVPNDRSTLTEFDEGNLLSLSRFAGNDRRERGGAAAYGVNWTRLDPGGWESKLVLGQVVREDRQVEPDGRDSLSDSSGLQDRYSDILVSGQIKTPYGLGLTARGLFDGFDETTKATVRADWRNELANIGATYIWLKSDPDENRADSTSEWAIDGSYRMSRHWTGSANWRYDTISNRNVRAGVGLTYTNECVETQFSVSRRFTSSTILEPSTDFSLTVSLRGFTAKTQDRSYSKKCGT